MGIYRIYKGEDDASHIEPLPPDSPFWASVKTTETMFLKEFPAGTFMDWHPAPRKQVVIIISGTMEHGFEDGATHRFGPGDVRVLVDTTGRGHTTRVVGDEPLLVAVIPLA